GPLGNGGTFTINGGTIDYTGGSSSMNVANVNPITLGGDFAYGGTKPLLLPGAVTLTGNRTITTNGSGTALTLGVIGDGGNNYSLTKAGTGTLILGGGATITQLAVTAGLLKMGSTVSLSSSTVVTLSGSGSFDIYSNTPTIAGLQDGATITSGSVYNSSNIRTLTLNVSGSNSYLYSGIIGTGAGTLGITKSGTGTQTLAGNNTYTGNTLVSSGTLIIDGSLAAGSTVSSLATLGGNGTVNGLTTLSAAGSIINPGTAGTVGNLALTGGLTASSGGAFNFDLSGGVTDRISLGAGGLTAGGTWTFTLNNLGGMSAGTPYTLLSGTGTWSSSPTLAFNLLGGLVLDDGYNGTGYKWDNTSGADSLTVQFSAIPEPTTWALLAFSLTTVMVLRRRRNS
ncbi:MAG: autotransporter-associated beta strand repeat-containing protein, partial [Terrimicrobiaceae bacterium]